MSMDYVEQKRQLEEKRRAKLRRELLEVADAARAAEIDRQVSGLTMYNFTGAEAKYSTEGECLLLLRDLVDWNYLEEKITAPLRHGQKFGLRQVAYKITKTGSALLNEDLEPDHRIADERIA